MQNDDARCARTNRQRRRIPRAFCFLTILLSVSYGGKGMRLDVVPFSPGDQWSRYKDRAKESMLILHWRDAKVGSKKQHLEFVNMDTEIDAQAKKKYAQIDKIHKFGYLHTGAWMVVLDTNTSMLGDAKILMLKRSPHVVTCPNYWSFLGEHSNHDEEPEDFVLRGMREELGEKFYNQFIQSRGKIQPLVEHPIFFKRDYDTPNGKRMDRQINYIFTIEMNTPVAVLQQLSKVDKEAVEVAWVTKNEIKLWLGEAPNEKFCHNATIAVVNLIMERLDSLELGAENRNLMA